MQIDDSIKNKLLALNDNELKNVVSSIANATGADISKLKMSDKDIAKLRSVIKNVTDAEADEAIKLIGGNGKATDLIEKARERGDK